VANAGSLLLNGQHPPVPGTPNVYKTPPAQDSQTIIVDIDYHIGTTTTNVSGILWRAHLGDPGEIDAATAITPSAAGVNSSGTVPLQASVPATNWWIAGSPPSGQTVSATSTGTVGRLSLHVVGTTPANNSDTDVTVTAWLIRHLVPGPGSTVLHFGPSAWIYGTSQQNPFLLSELPPFAPEPGQGKWWHNPLDTKTFHIGSGVGSIYYATQMALGKIGIEHVPEPATPLLLGGGIAALAVSRRIRRRRIETA
jgi:hypothetical protein